jgi:hypothetical protein
VAREKQFCRHDAAWLNLGRDSQPDRAITPLFALVLLALGTVVWKLPGDNGYFGIYDCLAGVSFGHLCKKITSTGIGEVSSTSSLSD